MAHPLDGFFGFSFGKSPLVSDVEGIFGFSFGKETNALFVVRNRINSPVNGVTLALSWNDGTPRTESILYDPGVVYERSLPAGVPVTVTATGAAYLDKTVTFTIGDNGFYPAVLLLEFRESYARIIKKRYL